MTRPKMSKAPTLRQLRRVLLVTIMLLSGGWSLANAANENWDIYLAIDNFGTVYFGSNTATVGGPLGTATDWHLEYNFTTSQPPDAFLYVATGSDHSALQGFVGRFTNTTLGKTAFTGDPAWEVFPAGKYASQLGIPDPWPPSTQPTQAQVDAAIAYATANNLWVPPTGAPGYDLDPGTSTAPYSYVWGYAYPNIWQSSDLPKEAQWIWFESGLVPGSASYPSPLKGGNHQEFLVFRVAGIVSPPHTGDWMNKDLQNEGSWAASDIAILLQGNVLPLVWHYDGRPSPNIGWGVFSTFTPTYPYPPVTGSNTLLHWSGFTDANGTLIDPGEIIHVGWCVNAPIVVLDAWWTDAAGNRLECAYVTQVGAYGETNGIFWQGVVWTNTFAPCGIPDNAVTLSDVQFAVFSTPVDPDSLNRWNVALTNALQPMSGGTAIPLPYDQSVTLPFPTPIPRDQWVVVKYNVESPGSEAGVTDFVLLRPVPETSQIPTLSEWGMIIFVVLLAGWMTFVVVRRWKASRATAA